MEKLNVELEFIEQNKPSTRRPTISILEAVDYAEPSGGHLDCLIWDVQLKAALSKSFLDNEGHPAMNHRMEMQAKNAELHQAWSTTMKLPRWDNWYCYAADAPEHPQRLQTWETVTEPFGLGRSELSVLKQIGERCLTANVKAKDKARILRSLHRKQAITTIGDCLVVNPAIVVGRNWWSPFMLGVFLVEWQEGVLIKIRVNSIDRYDRWSLETGSDWALKYLMRKCEKATALGNSDL